KKFKTLTLGPVYAYPQHFGTQHNIALWQKIHDCTPIKREKGKTQRQARWKRRRKKHQASKQGHASFWPM
ncbi:hypothetical protein CEXT_255671, partial [Caerostris extrusa]